MLNTQINNTQLKYWSHSALLERIVYRTVQRGGVFLCVDTWSHVLVMILHTVIYASMPTKSTPCIRKGATLMILEWTTSLV